MDPLTIIFTTGEAAGPSGIAIAAVAIFGLFALLGSPRSCSENSPNQARVQTAQAQMIPTAQNEQSVSEPTPDTFAAGMPAETTDASESTPLPITVNVSSETIQIEPTPTAVANAHAAEIVEIEPTPTAVANTYIEKIVEVEPTPVPIVDGVSRKTIHIKLIDNRRAHMTATIRGLTSLLFIHPPIVEIRPIFTGIPVVLIQDALGTCLLDFFADDYVDQYIGLETEYRLTFNVRFLQTTVDPVDLHIVGKQGNSIVISDTITLITPSTWYVTESFRPNELTREEMDEFMNQESRKMKLELEAQGAAEGTNQNSTLTISPADYQSGYQRIATSSLLIKELSLEEFDERIQFRKVIRQEIEDIKRRQDQQKQEW